MYELPDVTDIVAHALAEDLGVAQNRFIDPDQRGLDILKRDVTTFPIVGPDVRFEGVVVAREPCVVAGLPVAATVFERLSVAAGLFEPTDAFPLVAEGSSVDAGTAVMEVEGLAVAVLAAERTALDFLMVLSGIATATRAWVEEVGADVCVLDTRKTLPGLRALSKYAVRVGGGRNHRAGLHDMVLVKDNHLRHASVTEAVMRARGAHPDLLVEVEADTVEQALEAVQAGADIVLLDNMSDEELSYAVQESRAAAAALGRAVALEASGGITLARAASISATGVDRVSSSALTLAPPVDFGLDER